jgi:hypothetical protein
VTNKQDKPIEKISWLYSLLAGKSHLGCIGVLFEIALLIEYAKTLDEGIQKEMKQLIRNPKNLRSFFSELYIYYLLDLQGISNKKKIKVGNQIIEGTCTMAGKEFLFECRKLYMPNLEELDIKRRLLNDLYFFGNSLKHGYGMICTIHFKKPLQAKHRLNFAKMIRQYFEGFNKLKSAPTINYTHEDELGTFKAINYDILSFEEITKLKSYDILFYLIQPENPIPNIPYQYVGKIISNFGTSKRDIYKKLEQILKEKKEQHKNSIFKNKIIFLDSESFPEFQMGLFTDSKMYDKNEIIRICNKLNLKEIICVIRRYYLNEYPEVFVDIIRPENLNDIDSELKLLFA